ncbi:MAG TPA: PadR family transcriptional regulator [Acidimicrobiales bacterium]|nr:PadR family transcriptional regulator [Acidimicrobiales bacterium]
MAQEMGRQRGRGRGPWWEDWGGEWGGPMRGPRMRRGDIRWALLGALTDGPGHGYELITRLEEHHGGIWRPSPGSVYPTLQMLEDEGLVRSEERDGKRVYELTDAGRSALEERTAHQEAGPGEAGFRPSRGRGRRFGEKIGPAIGPLVMAVRQVAMSGDEDQLDRAAEILRRATKEIYQLLASTEA